MSGHGKPRTGRSATQPGPTLGNPASTGRVKHCADSERMAELVNRVALEIENDERRLRQQIRSLIENGQVQQAIRLLSEWDDSPASDVLRDRKGRGRAG